MKRKNRKIPVRVAAATLAVLLVFAFSVRGFASANRAAILERNAELLRENTEHHAKAVSDILNSRQRFVENLAILLERSSENDYRTLVDTLNAIGENTFLDELSFITHEGIWYASDGQKQDIRAADFFKNGMKGESGITELEDSFLNPGMMCVSYYAPVRRGGEVAGLIVGCNYYESFDELYSVTTAEAYIYSFLVEGDGRVLVSNREEDKNNVFSFLKERMEPEPYRELLSHMKDGNTVYGSYRGDYGEGLVCFSPLGINDWYVLQLFSSGRTAEIVAPLNKSAYALESAMLLCLILSVGYTLSFTYGRYNQKNRLMEIALGALEETYPHICRINYRTGVCVFIKDHEGIVKKTFRKYDWTEIRTRLLGVIHPEDLEKFKSFTSPENMRRVREQGIVSDTCIYRREYEGEYQWIQTKILPVNDEEDCILMYAGKVDETVKAEEFYKVQLWKTMQKVKAAETEKSELLKYMSRNLQVPVKAMEGMTSLAYEVMKKGQYAEAARYLSRVDSLGSYTLTVLDDIMQIGVIRGQQIRCKKAPLSVREMLDGYKEYCEEIKQTDSGIFVEVICDEKLQEQYIGDEARIMQVLHALLGNAYGYNREGGRVILSAGLVEPGEKSDEVFFAVRDTGRGMDEEYKMILTEAFAEDRQPSKGVESVMGIGLFLAKIALDSMGGQLKLESVPGEGTCVTVYLKLEHAPEPGKAEAEPTRVLLVDDNTINLEMVAEILREEGYETVTCDSGSHALRAFLDSGQGYFRVLLTDIKMPGMDGNELARRVRLSGRGDSESICILGMTVSCDAREREELLESGLEDVTDKPFRVNWLKEHLQKRRK